MGNERCADVPIASEKSSEGWREGTNLFVVVATDPGSRKSAVLRDMTAPLLGLERLLLEEVRPDGEGRPSEVVRLHPELREAERS